jgi:hypothetical protein
VWCCWCWAGALVSLDVLLFFGPCPTKLGKFAAHVKKGRESKVEGCLVLKHQIMKSHNCFEEAMGKTGVPGEEYSDINLVSVNHPVDVDRVEYRCIRVK